MRFSHLIGTIKETIAEGQLKVGGLSTVTPSAPRPAPRPSSGIPAFGANLGRAMAPTSPPAPRPAPTQLHARGGAIFGGSSPQSSPQRASQPTPVIDRAMNRAAAAPQRPALTMGSSRNTQTPSGGGIARDVGRAPQSSTVAPSTATRPATTPAPKPTPLQRSSAKIAQKQQSRSRPVVRPRPAARPIKRAQTYRQAADAGSSLSGAHQAGLRESLIREIKNIARKKNGKCDTNTEEGDNPKGAPYGFELNPRINSSIRP